VTASGGVRSVHRAPRRHRTPVFQTRWSHPTKMKHNLSQCSVTKKKKKHNNINKTKKESPQKKTKVHKKKKIKNKNA